MKAGFFCVRIDETEHWESSRLHPALRECRKFGVYLVCNGEATFCCSLTPSSGAEWLRNEFDIDYADLPPVARDEVEGLEWENGGDGFSYIRFTPHCPDNPLHSELIEFESDEADDDAARADLWEQAREYFQGNWPCFPFAASVLEASA